MNEKIGKPPILDKRELTKINDAMSAEAKYGDVFLAIAHAQYDALVAYYEPLIEQTQEQMGKLSASIAKSWQIVAQGQRDIDEVAIQQAKAEVAREIIPLIDKLFEALDHADFSNGVEANGIDEGRVRANQHIGELGREYLSFKSKYGGQK